MKPNIAAKPKIEQEKDRRASEKSIAAYEKVVNALIETAKRRIMVVEGSARKLSFEDLINQHFARSAVAAKSTIRSERTALLRAFLVGHPEIGDGQSSREAWNEIGKIKPETAIEKGEQLLRDWLAGTTQSDRRKGKAGQVEIARQKAEDAERLLRSGPVDEGVRIEAMKAIVEWAELRPQTIVDEEMIAELAGVKIERLGQKSIRKEYGKTPLEKWVETGKSIAPELEHPGVIYQQKTLANPCATTARVFFEATLATGLRPVEWLNAEFVVDDPIGNPMPAIETPDPDAAATDKKRNPRLVVENAKLALSPTGRKYRTLRLEPLPPEIIRAILWASALRHAEVNAENWGKIIVLVNRKIDRAAKANGFERGMSLYDLRHYFADRAKKVLPREEVAALMGHGSTKSAGAYGRKTSRGSGGGSSAVRPLLPLADKNDVAAVEAVLARKQETRQRMEKNMG